MIRSNELSREQVRGLICNLFIQMSREIDKSAGSRLSEWDRNEQLYCSTEISASVEEQRETGAYDREVKLIAQRALAASNLSLSDITSERRDDLLDGAARALIERERFYQLRIKDRLAPFVATDPLFNFLVSDHAEVPVTSGPTLGGQSTSTSHPKRVVGPKRLPQSGFVIWDTLESISGTSVGSLL